MSELSDWEKSVIEAEDFFYKNQQECIIKNMTIADIAKSYLSKKRTSWGKEKAKYMKSEAWRILREKVMKKNDNKCMECGKDAECVHHLTYDNLYTNVEEFDCIPLCNKCHMKKHNLKQGQNENNVFVGKCYMCNKEKFIFRVDSWSSVEIDDSISITGNIKKTKTKDRKYIRGSWRNFCKDCLLEWGWDANREYNKCTECYGDFLGKKNEAKCKVCKRRYFNE